MSGRGEACSRLAGSLLRSRWAALGAAVVVALGAGSVLTSSAVGSPAPTSATFVAITPCRLIDTRAGAQVGPRATPLGADETYVATVWGNNGRCTIPATATAMSLNVTATDGTATSFLTVFPADKAWPGTSNVNFSAGQPPTSNAATSLLSTDGRLAFFNAAGTVNLIVDVVGFYGPFGAGPAAPLSSRCGATLRWDLAGCRAATYPTLLNPVGVAFDGTSIWITNNGSASVSKMNPVTGARVDYPTLLYPIGVAFDGTSIWITNYGSASVSKMDPATGTRVDYPTLNAPWGLAFDGTSIWVADAGAGSVSKMDPATGARVDYPAQVSPIAIAFDGASIWIANYGSASVSKMDPATGARVDYPTLNNPYAVAFDGTSIWITNKGSASVSKMNPATGTRVDYPTLNRPAGLAFDGTDIWIANFDSGVVSKMDPDTGARVDYPALSGPDGVAFDGTNIWVTNHGSASVSKFVP